MSAVRGEFATLTGWLAMINRIWLMALIPICRPCGMRSA